MNTRYEKLPSYFRHAIKAAGRSPHPRYKIGAALLDKRQRLIVSGHNQFKTHTKIHGPQTLHAEIHALSRARRKSDHIVVVRICGNHFALARPCKSCMALLKKAGITHVDYTTNSGWASEYITI